ncbi:MAG TPA: tetratricopeptide repeat protein [Thermoanaerobaculia bacterium]|jgi:tetratricopeptide (TPR) repeat protein
MLLRAVLSISVAAAWAAAIAPASLRAQDWRGGKARVDGIVKNEKGEPIEGCKVSMRWGRSTHGGPDLTTDKKGRWAIFGLVGGPWDLDFEAPGYQTKKISADLQEGSRNPSVEIQLEPAAQAAPAGPAAPAEVQISVGGKKISKETAAAIDAGNQAMAAKNWAGARENYVKALAELPDNTPLMERVAAAYLGEGNTDEAVRYARQVAEKDPQETGAWMMIAEIELQRGNLDAGKAALDKIPPEKVTDPQPYLNIGILSINAKKPAEAEPAFDRAIAIKPDLADAYYYRGLARMQLKKNAEAKADLQKALELAPNGPDAKDIRDLLKTMP